ADDQPVEQDRRPDVRMRLSGVAGPRPRRNPDCRGDACQPLHEHQRGEHAVGSRVDLMLVLLSQLVRQLARGSVEDEILGGGRHHGRLPCEIESVTMGQPKTGVVWHSAEPSVSSETRASCPALSPSCPRAAVMPPEKSRWPAASYMSVWPEVKA